MSTLRHTSISDASKGTLIMGGNAILDPTRFVTQSLNGNEPVPDGDTNDVCRQRHHSRTTQSRANNKNRFGTESKATTVGVHPTPSNTVADHDE